MNPECESNSVHGSPRPQQPRRILSPSEYAAAGDAPRGQTSPDLSFDVPQEIFAMDPLLLTTVTTSDRKARNRLTDSCVHSNVSQIRTFSNDPLEKVVSVTDKDSSLFKSMSIANPPKGKDNELRFTSQPRTIRNNSDHHISLERELPCKEYSQDPRNLPDDQTATTEWSELTKVIAEHEEDMGVRNLIEDYNAEEILSPGRKISMFSKEIWTEKVLPIDTFVCPESKLVKNYFEKKKKKMNDQFNRLGNQSTESLDSAIIKRGTRRDLLNENHLIQPLLSAREGRTLSSGQKTINFDNEIWPVYPKIIPSGKELSIPILESRHEIISPEKLNETGEEIAALTHSRCSPLTDANIIQYDTESSSRSVKMIESTHEIKDENDLTPTTDGRKFSAHNYPQSTISQLSVEVGEKLHSFDNADRIFWELNPVKNIRVETESGCFSNEPIKLDSLGKLKSSQRLTPLNDCKQEMVKSFESSRTRARKKNLLSSSHRQPVRSVLRDIVKRKGIDSLDDGELSLKSCDKIVSLDETSVEQNKEDCDSSFYLYSKAETIKHVDSGPVKNRQADYNDVDKIFSTPTDMICEISREVDAISQFKSTLSSCNKMQRMNAELHSRNQGARREFDKSENHVKLLDSTSSSKLPLTESINIQENIDIPNTKKNRKCVKVVRFETCDETDGDIKFNEKVIKLQENFEDRECMSVKRIRQDFKQLAHQISEQIELDSDSADAVVTLAKVEIIVEANRQMVEKLHQLQPNTVIPQLTPPDAGKSLAKALMRCKNYLQNNGYSSDATATINKLLTTGVQNLRQMVEWQKLVLSTRCKKYCIIPGDRSQSKRSHRQNSSNIDGFLTAKNFGVHQVQFLIADILMLTEKIVPKINGEMRSKLIVTPNHPQNNKNEKMIMNTVTAETNETDTLGKSNTTSVAEENGTIQSLDLKKPEKVEEVIKNNSEKPVILSGVFSDLQESNNQPNMQIQRNRRTDKELETTQLSTTRSSYPKKISSTESTKTLRQLFNELWEKRSKTLSHRYYANDSTINSKSQAGSCNATINQKTPVWKPGGNNSTQSSMSVISNNQKIRPLPSSSANKKKNTSSENTRDARPHQHTKTISSACNDLSKIPERQILRSHNTTSLAKINTLPARGNHSEMLSVGRSKISTKVDETKERKPRSKSRTRTTKIPNKISRIAVTEIPLEHVNYCPTINEQQTSVVKELPLINKATSSPKAIMRMLEDLIMFTSNETSIYDDSLTQVVARCNVAVKGVNRNNHCSALPKTEVKLKNVIDSAPPNKQDYSRTEESSVYQSIQAGSIEKIIEQSQNTDAMKGNGIFIDKETAYIQNTPAESRVQQKESDCLSTLHAEELLTVSGSHSDATSKNSTEEYTTISVSNVGCTAYLSSDRSVLSVSSKCCQASSTSLMSHETSEELFSDQVLESGVNSCCKKTSVHFNESFNATEDDEATEENFTQVIRNDQTTSASSGAMLKKKIINRHSKSLEILKEILSDQGLDTHLLSRAENALNNRCKCNSKKRELTPRRSLQSANLITSGVSSDPINKVSLLERNLPTSLFGKLATLSESEYDIEHMEVATMTSANISTVSTKDCASSIEFDFHGKEENKEYLNNIVTVENATQFDITLKSDVCVGDGIICDTHVGHIAKNEENFIDDIARSKTPPATLRSSSYTDEILSVNNSESLECKLPHVVLDAFKLAAIRATNFYAAVNVLRENIRYQNIQSNPDVNQDSNEILIDVSTSQRLEDHERRLNEDFSIYSDIESMVQTEKLKTGPPVKIIISRTPVEISNETNCSESTKSSTLKLQRKTVDSRNMTTLRESMGNAMEDEMRSTHNLDDLNHNRHVVLPKPFLTMKKNSTTNVGENKNTKKPITDLGQVIVGGIKSACDNEIHLGSEIMQNEPSSSSQKSSVERCATAKRIETLHFAGKQTAFVVGNTTNSGLQDIIGSNSRSLIANVANYRSPKTGDGINNPLSGSRIKTLLAENLKLFKTDYNTIIDKRVLTDCEDDVLESSGDEVLIIDEGSGETCDSVSYTRFHEYDTFLKVKDLVNSLLKKVEENHDSSTINKQNHAKLLSPRYRSPRKYRRRSETEEKKRTVRQSEILCGKFWNPISDVIISKEHLLFSIYAAICSFVFICLQLPVHCEVE